LERETAAVRQGGEVERSQREREVVEGCWAAVVGLGYI